MANDNLKDARNTKNDEFYTQFQDIEREVNAYLDYNPDVFRNKTILLPCDDPEWSNFTRFFALKFDELGLKRLISTSYAPESKLCNYPYQPSLFEIESPQFDTSKAKKNGKIFILERDNTGDGRIDINDLEWSYLEGDGDFRSDEVTALRDESDVIVTNPPFSLFREFWEWITETDKLFLIIGNKNCVTYKEVFPFFKENKVWTGRKEWNGGMWFETKNISDVDKVVDGVAMKNVASFWLTNIEHGRRHQPIPLMTMDDNLKFSKHKEIREKGKYEHYDNYDAIEIPYTNAIPSDYNGVMGVPISFLDKYCPEQFEIIGATESEGKGFSNGLWHKDSKTAQPLVNGEKKFKRLFIKKI